MRLYILLVFLISIFFVAGCKKDKNTSPQNNGPTTALNGWSYHGSAPMLFSSESNKYQLFLCKVHEYSGGIIDVFYGTRYTLFNANGLVTTGSTRWMLKSDGSTVRNTNDLMYEFNPASKRLFQGQTAEVIPPVDVEVLGTGAGEFKVYNPIQIVGNLNAPSGGQLSGKENYNGSASPRSISNSLVCHFIEPDIKVDVSDIYWYGYTLGIGKNPTTGEYFVLTYHRDSSFVMLNAVTPQNFSTNYGTMRKMQPLLGKKLKEIIPNWATNPVDMDIWPLYYQYSADPSGIYFLVQNQTKIYVLKVNLNNFQFSLVHQYQQPRNSTFDYANEIFEIQFLDKEQGTFLFCERRQSGMYALLHKNGSTQQIVMPQFKGNIVQTITSLRFDNEKYWLIVADQNKNVHLFSKNY